MDTNHPSLLLFTRLVDLVIRCSSDGGRPLADGLCFVGAEGGDINGRPSLVRVFPWIETIDVIDEGWSEVGDMISRSKQIVGCSTN